MNKFKDLLKPFYSIILGALILLCYLNNLQWSGTVLALGIVAMVLAAYYLVIGIVSVCTKVMSDAMRKTFECVSVVLFPLFMFVQFLLVAIDGGLGPNGWVIVVLSMLASVSLVVVYSIASFGKVGALNKTAQLFSFIFILALLLNVLFTTNGNPNVLGNINVVRFVTYLVYSGMLLSALPNLAEEKTSETQNETTQE